MLTLTYNNMKIGPDGNQLEAYTRTMRAHSVALPDDFEQVRQNVWQKSARSEGGMLTVVETWRVHQEAA